jgi:hypothetical protein
MNSLFQLDIPKRSTHCGHQGERLLPGMDIYSLLLEGEQDFKRRDFCATCWTQIEKEPDSHRGYWKSKIEPKKPATEISRPARALALLQELLNTADPDEAEIFVLSLFLARARQLALRQEVQREGSLYYLYEIVGQEQFLTIKAHDLSDLQIEVLQKSLASKLKHAT